MVNTINISLPTKLKEAADALVASGEYASFSDLARSAIRQTILDKKYRAMIDEAKKERLEGEGKLLKNRDDIDSFINEIAR